MTEALKLQNFTTEELENLTGLDCVFEDIRKDWSDWSDFFDDMVAHILIGKFRFCVDIEKESDKEVANARKRLISVLKANNIEF